MVTHSEKAIPDLMSVLNVKVQIWLRGSALSTWRSWASHWAAGQSHRAAGQSHQPHSSLVTLGNYSLCPIMWSLLQGGPCSPALSVLQEESWGKTFSFPKMQLWCVPHRGTDLYRRETGSC